MKKILRQVGTKYRAKCYQCDTEFEYESSDLVHSNAFKFIGVTCPNCGSLLEHKGNPSSKLTTEII